MNRAMGHGVRYWPSLDLSSALVADETRYLVCSILLKNPIVLLVPPRRALMHPITQGPKPGIVWQSCRKGSCSSGCSVFFVDYKSKTDARCLILEERRANTALPGPRNPMDVRDSDPRGISRMCRTRSQDNVRGPAAWIAWIDVRSALMNLYGPEAVLSHSHFMLWLFHFQCPYGRLDSRNRL
jgi:hypothetical protein